MMIWFGFQHFNKRILQHSLIWHKYLNLPQKRLKMEWTSFYEPAVQLTRQAGEIVKQGYEKMVKGETLINQKLNPQDLVTEFDKQVEHFLFTELKKKFPTHEFVGEESVSEAGKAIMLTDKPTWVIDPIDGTMNFVHKFPFSAICVGLMVDKKVVIGIVYHVLLDLMYTAQKGKGAFCNNQKLHVSNKEDLANSLVVYELGSSRTPERLENHLRNIRKIQESCHGIRILGSCALDMCQIASGRAEGFAECGIHIWDYCASSLIVQEAGGVVIDPSGADVDFMARRLMCANSRGIANSLAKLIDFNDMKFERDGP